VEIGESMPLTYFAKHGIVDDFLCQSNHTIYNYCNSKRIHPRNWPILGPFNKMIQVCRYNLMRHTSQGLVTFILNGALFKDIYTEIQS
jgi:hypothetical protein